MFTSRQSHIGTGLQSPLAPDRITTALDGYPRGTPAVRRGKTAPAPFVPSTDAR
jgi:hypothetical protein